jgi:hypothetical protein
VQQRSPFVSALVAQWIEHQTSNLGVAGSSPARGILFDIVLASFCFWVPTSVQVWPSG